MSSTGKQSPLGINVAGSFLQHKGLTINPIAAGYMGTSRINSEYNFGSIVQNTCLRLLTWTINDAYYRGIEQNSTVDSSTYNNLIDIGNGKIPALGNAKPPTYIIEDPSGQWNGQATTGYYIESNLGQGQSATWLPYNTSNVNRSITQWGYIRLHALQAWNEFNWNGVPTSPVMYNDFVSSLLTAQGFIDYMNVGINAAKAAPEFLDGVYSNMNDLITADVTGVSLALSAFGQDCITLGKVIDLTKISKFGLPSTFLQTLAKYNALTPSLVLALVSSGLSYEEVNTISNGTALSISIEQEQQIYGAFLVIFGKDLAEILIPLNCKNTRITCLADFFDLKKLFPNSYASLTVPVYNTSPGPTNSKTYYPIFSGGNVNGNISSPAINSIIGTIVQPGTPPVNEGTTEQDQALPEGFGSYLIKILPRDLAISCGAFAYSMQQIKNVQMMSFEKFAQVAVSLETTKGLDKVNGTKVPSDVALAEQSYNILGLGSGPNKTYTASDFFGCMSGLPYLWNDIKTGIDETETVKLRNIYREMFLSVTWEKAICTIEQTANYDLVQPYLPPIPNPDYDPLLPPDPVTNPELSFEGQPAIYNLWYTAFVSAAEPGGGYGRGTAPPPVVTLSPNNPKNSVTTSIGTDDSDAASVNNGSFGRVTFQVVNTGLKCYYMYDLTINDPAPPDISLGGEYGPPLETVSTEAPPTAILAVNPDGSVATNGTNTAGDVYTAIGVNPPGTVITPAPRPGPGPTGQTVTPRTGTSTRPVNSYFEDVDINVYVEVGTEVPIVITGGVPNTEWEGVLRNYPYGSNVATTFSGVLDAYGNWEGISVTPNVPGDYFFLFTFDATGNSLTPWIRAVTEIYVPVITAVSTVTSGQPFDVEMSGFEPNTNIYWEVSGPTGYTTIAGSVVADANGSHLFSALVLSIAGTYTIKSGKYSGNGYSAEHTLTVT